MGAGGDFGNDAAEGAEGAIWPITSSARISPAPSALSRTTAAAVSSQVVWMPRTCMDRFCAGRNDAPFLGRGCTRTGREETRAIAQGAWEAAFRRLSGGRERGNGKSSGWRPPGMKTGRAHRNSRRHPAGPPAGAVPAPDSRVGLQEGVRRGARRAVGGRPGDSPKAAASEFHVGRLSVGALRHWPRRKADGRGDNAPTSSIGLFRQLRRARLPQRLSEPAQIPPAHAGVPPPRRRARSSVCHRHPHRGRGTARSTPSSAAGSTASASPTTRAADGHVLCRRGDRHVFEGRLAALDYTGRRMDRAPRAPGGEARSNACSTGRWARTR